jgi:hypothetical protein
MSRNPETYSETARGGGQLHSQVTHIASLLFFTTQQIPTAVQAFAGGDTTGTDGWDAVTFRCGDGRDATVGTIASTGTVGPDRHTVERIELFGDRGHAAYDMADGTLTIHGYDGTNVDDAARLSVRAVSGGRSGRARTRFMSRSTAPPAANAVRDPC